MSKSEKPTASIDSATIMYIEKSAFNALEVDRDRWYKKFTELETDRASCCVANEEENVELKAKLDEANEHIASLTCQCADLDTERANLEEKLHDLEQFDPFYKNWEVERGLLDQENKDLQSQLNEAMEMISKLESTLMKVNKISESPEFISIFHISQLHPCSHRGEQYGDDVRAALSSIAQWRKEMGK